MNRTFPPVPLLDLPCFLLYHTLMPFLISLRNCKPFCTNTTDLYDYYCSCSIDQCPHHVHRKTSERCPGRSQFFHLGRSEGQRGRVSNFADAT